MNDARSIDLVEAVVGGVVPTLLEHVEGVVKAFTAQIGELKAEIFELKKQLAEVRVAEGPPGKDGRDGAAGDNGIDGRDGAPGRDGLPGRDGANGKDGTPGLDGKDGAPGLGLDDIAEEALEDGGRVLVRRFKRGGEVVKEIRMVTTFPVDRGVWQAGDYAAGDMVTYQGSLFIAQRGTTGEPEKPDGGWRLAVKRGRDGRHGRDGKDGAKGDAGPTGPAGKDLTQMGVDGRKW